MWNGIEINAIDFGRTEQWRCKQDCSGADQSKISIVPWFQRVSDVEDVDSNCIFNFSGSRQQNTTDEDGDKLAAQTANNESMIWTYPPGNIEI